MFSNTQFDLNWSELYTISSVCILNVVCNSIDIFYIVVDYFITYVHVSYLTWHRRLGHHANVILKKLFQLWNTGSEFDSDGEFHGALTHCLASISIHHTVICPHTSQQNDIVECKYGHIVELGLTLLAQASPHFKYLSDPFSSNVFLINRFTYWCLGSGVSSWKTFPIIFFKCVPHYQFLGMFGGFLIFEILINTNLIIGLVLVYI